VVAVTITANGGILIPLTQSFGVRAFQVICILFLVALSAAGIAADKIWDIASNRPGYLATQMGICPNILVTGAALEHISMDRLAPRAWIEINGDDLPITKFHSQTWRSVANDTGLARVFPLQGLAGLCKPDAPRGEEGKQEQGASQGYHPRVEVVRIENRLFCLGSHD
jgi:hypothetical protein